MGVVGGVKRLCGLLVVISLLIVLVIVVLPRLVSVKPQHIFTYGPATASSHWNRLAIFYVQAGRYHGRNVVSALLTETAGDCRRMSTKNRTSLRGIPVDIYLLYTDDNELETAQASNNENRYLRRFQLNLLLIALC